VSLKVIDLAVDQLVPNGWNSNMVSPQNEAKLDEAIKRLGIFKPIVARYLPDRDKYEILGGEHRWGSAKRLGMQTVPVINLGTIDDKRAKEISLADNSRYGVDDSMALATLMSEIGSPEEVSNFLPYSDIDVQSILSSVDIAVSALDFDETIDEPGSPEPPATKAPKTHTVMRFKVPLRDAESITALIAKTQKHQGLNDSDELTNAGDALVHLLLGRAE
jgi:hypothetical protein